MLTTGSAGRAARRRARRRPRPLQARPGTAPGRPGQSSDPWPPESSPPRSSLEWPPERPEPEPEPESSEPSARAVGARRVDCRGVAGAGARRVDCRRVVGAVARAELREPLPGVVLAGADAVAAVVVTGLVVGDPGRAVAAVVVTVTGCVVGDPCRTVAAVVVARLGLRGAGGRARALGPARRGAARGRAARAAAGRTRRCRAGRRGRHGHGDSGDEGDEETCAWMCPFEVSVSVWSDGAGSSRAGRWRAHLGPHRARGGSRARRVLLMASSEWWSAAYPARAVTHGPAMDAAIDPWSQSLTQPVARIRSTRGNTHSRALPACVLPPVDACALRPAGAGRRWRGWRRARTAPGPARCPRRSW